MTIPTFMNEPELTGLVRICGVNKNYLYPRVFPFRDCSNDELVTWVELAQNPLAPFVSVDGVTPKMSGDIYAKLAYSVAYIRFKKQYKQSDLRLFEEIAASQHSEVARMQFDKKSQIQKDVMRLRAACDARLEWMAINALAGQIAVADGGVRFTIDYPGPFTGSTNKRSPTTYWGDTGATPVQDLMLWIEEVGDHCADDPVVGVFPRRVLRTLSEDAGIRDLWFTGQAGLTSGALPRGFVIEALKMVGLQEVIVYDAKYTTLTYSTSTGLPTRSVSRVLSNNHIFLLPAGPVGNMRTAPGPDAITTGFFAWNKEEVDPWITEVGCGIYAIPEIADVNTWAYCQVLESAT